jgi:hypothetical protein
MNSLLGDINAKIGREDIFKPTIGNKSLHEITNGNGVTGVMFATPRNLVFKSTRFPHRNIINTHGALLKERHTTILITSS